MAALGCLGVACIESVPVQTIDGAQSGLLILEDRDRRRVIAFEGRTNVPIGPEVTRAAMLSLGCPLATYGIPEAELELGDGKLGGSRLLPTPLETEGLEALGLLPLPLGDLAEARLPVVAPWQDLAPLLDQNGNAARGDGFSDSVAAFGDRLLGVNTLAAPFAREAVDLWGTEGDGVSAMAMVAAPRGPGGEARAAFLVQTNDWRYEIRVMERLSGEWRAAAVLPVPDFSRSLLGLAASWRGSTPRFLVVAEDAIHWSQDRGGWESLRYSDSKAFFFGRLIGAAPQDSGWTFSLRYGEVRTYRLADGEVESVPLQFVAEAQDGGRWEIDAGGRLLRWTAAEKLLPVDGPETELSLMTSHDGALLAMAGGVPFYWPAEPCAPPWRWILNAPSRVERLALTDAYLFASSWDSFSEWRARPDRTPTDDLE